MSNNICDRACENQPCEHKLHRIIFLLISFIPNTLSHFWKLQKKAIKFCSSDEDFVTVVQSYDTANTVKIGDFLHLDSRFLQAQSHMIVQYNRHNNTIITL